MKNCFLAIGVLVSAFVALLVPHAVSAALPTSTVPWLLGVVMFGMGLTLKASDFLPLLKHPLDVGIGILAQFILMPLIAVVLVHVLHLPSELALGVILVGCCPGGTASNVITYLAKGDVAFSIAMTSATTLLAPVMTPLLVLLAAGHSIEVNALAMALSVVKVVILPIALGVAANTTLPRLVAHVQKGMPVFSALVIVVIVAAVTAANAAAIRKGWGLVVLAVVLHNLLGMALGYLLARLVHFNTAKCRTLAIEVGMQNSGLAVSLATLHFAAYPMATVPGALFSVWHNLSGSLYATLVKGGKDRADTLA